MVDLFPQFMATAAGAVAGAYSAYRLAERRIGRQEKEDYLALLLMLKEHMEILHRYLSDHEIKEGVVIFSKPFVPPPITESQIERLMKIAPDKKMPQTLIHIVDYCRTIGGAGQKILQVI